MAQIYYTIHAISWPILIILFLISYFAQGQKISQHILRLFYLIMVGTGILMLFSYGFPLQYVVKGILAIALIGMMESLLVRKKRGNPTGLFWGLWIVLLLIVLVLGYNKTLF